MKTTKLNKVLIALDYDPTAQKVASLGYSMASAMNAEVTLLHIISDPVYYSSTAYSPIMGLIGEMETFPMQLENIEGLKVVSQQFLDKFKHHLGDEAIKTLVGEGDFATTILKTAKSIHADVIVMGSHSKKWLENIVLGSVTGDVLKHTTIPLFIVPTKKQE
ncbi:MAG: universal stress protein [Bacteroidales bacterium]|nr:universal stress protein [Bacteroidales bacterium]